MRCPHKGCQPFPSPETMPEIRIRRVSVRQAVSFYPAGALCDISPAKVGVAPYFFPGIHLQGGRTSARATQSRAQVRSKRALNNGSGPVFVTSSGFDLWCHAALELNDFVRLLSARAEVWHPDCWAGEPGMFRAVHAPGSRQAMIT